MKSNWQECVEEEIKELKSNVVQKANDYYFQAILF